MKKIQIARQAPDAESGAADGSQESASSRKKVSTRDFLNTSGEVVERIEEATGARYTLLGDGGKPFDKQFGQAGTPGVMFAIFGFHTKVGNVANTVLNDKEEPGTPADAAAAIDEFIKLADEGKWAERAAGGVGARIDKDALAAAVVAVAQKNGQQKDLVQVREKLEDNPGLVRTLRQNADIAAEYNSRVGKTAKPTDEVLNLV